MVYKRLVLFVIVLFLLFSFVSAETFSIDPCAGDTVITEDASNYYMDSACFNVVFDKVYTEESPISFYDSYNDDYFDLKLHSLTEQNSILTNQQRLYSFEDIGLTASIEGDKVVYTSSDGKIRLLYSVSGNQVKAGFEVIDWTNYYTTSNFFLRTLIHKEDTATSHFINLPAVVDGIEQPLITESEFSGVNEFVVQTLYTGGSFSYLEIDPLYQVDYSPTPATHLISGLVETESESQFESEVDVTSIMSDNISSTSVRISESTSGGVNNTLDYSDAGFEGSEFLANNNEFLAVDFNITNYNLISNMFVCGRALEEDAVTDDIRISTNTTFRNAVSFPEGTAPTSYTCFSFDKAWVSEGVNRIGFGCFGGCSAPKDRFFISTDTTVPTSGKSYYYESASWSLEAYDLGIKLIIQYNNLSTGNAVSGRWSQTYDPVYNWYGQVYKTTSGTSTLHIQAYDNSNDVSSVEVTHILVGTGWFATNVSSLMDYMTNNLSLGYSQFRFWTEDSQNISEMVLRQEVNDTTSPTISNCLINDTNIVTGEITRLQCNVTDDVLVDDVNGTISSVSYTFIKNDDIYYKDFTCDVPINGTNDWTLVEAYDIATNYDSTNPALSFFCNTTVVCVEDWVLDTPTCLINDSYIKSYTDNNSCGTVGDLPVDNGTQSLCNYCSEDIVLSSETECYFNGTAGVKNITYIDNNYFSCCAITGIGSDCSIDFSPYNDTIEESCSLYEDDFELSLDAQVSFGFGIGGLQSDKVYGKIWINNTNTTYTCISYIEVPTTGELVQTNPPYTKRTTSLVQIVPKEIEDREFFITRDGLANVYWTSDNLVIDGRNYIFGVECAGNGMNLKSEVLTQVGYDPVNEPITRWFWLKENMTGLVLGLLLTIILIFFIGWGIRELRQR